VVVVGGGVMGASIAFHLAEAGVEGVVLLERGALASGSTSRAAGGVRSTFSDELNVKVALRSLDALAAFGDRPGWEIDLRRDGYLFLLARKEDVEAFERGVEMQRSLGARTELVDPARASELSPLAGTDGVLAAAFDPLAGIVSPESVVQGYAAGAHSHGARVLTNCPVQRIATARGRVSAVETPRGELRAAAVVIAAGVWSPALAEPLGLALPVTPLPRRIAYTAPLDGLPEAIPLTIDFESGFYFHREGRGLLFGSGHEAGGSQQEWLEWAAPVIERRCPALADAGIAGGWSGLYEMTPDHNALIGEADAPSRLLYATGFSGHGFQMGPAVGEIVRDLYLGREPFVDVAPLSAARDLPRPERNIV
jgi:sarcosine oxidase, subunit beta